MGSKETAELLDSALVGGTPSPIMMTQTIFFLFLSSCSAAPAFFDYWDQMIQNNTILDRIEDYRSYLPESLNSYLNKTLDDGLEMAYDLYDDFKEEVLEKSTQQVDAMTDLMKNFISRVLSIHKDIGNVLEQDPALTDEEIQEKNDKEGLKELRARFESMQSELQKEVAEDKGLPEGVEQVIQTFITTIREMMASMSDREAEFWSKLKQMEVEFWKLKSVLADTSGQLKERVSSIFKTLQEVDLYKIGSEESPESEEDMMEEPRAS